MSSTKEINFVNISVNSLVTDSATGDSHVSKESRQKRHWTVFYCIYMSTYLVQVNYFYLQYVIDFRKSLTCWLSELNDTNETTKHAKIMLVQQHSLVCRYIQFISLYIGQYAHE